MGATSCFLQGIQETVLAQSSNLPSSLPLHPRDRIIKERNLQAVPLPVNLFHAAFSLWLGTSVPRGSV